MSTPDKQTKGGAQRDKGGVKRKTQSSAMTKCTKCSKDFGTLAECLRHELLVHESNISFMRMNKKTLNLPKHMARALLEDAKDEPPREALQAVLEHCPSGDELQTLFGIYCLNSNNMAWVTRRIIENLQREIDWIAHVKVYPFGSISTGLALKGSDLDFYVAERGASRNTNGQFNSRSRYIFNKINGTLHRSSDFESVFAIRAARVPIIKCKHVETGFSLDINTTCASSVENTNFFRDLIHSNPQIYEAMLFLKIWAKKQKIIKPGHLSSYCFMTMVVFSLQQPGEGYDPLLPPIHQLQNHRRPLVVGAVNYAYDLTELGRRGSRATSVRTLIKHFFRFYKDFHFGDYIVAPNYGSPVSRADFMTGKFVDPSYQQLLRALTEYSGAPADELQVDRCMIVQDVFHLNLNISKQVAPSFLEYFCTCTKWSAQICADPHITSDKQLYHRLLFCVLDKIQNIYPEPPNPPEAQPPYATSYNCQMTLKYDLLASREEMEIFSNMAKKDDSECAEQRWAKHYINTIKEIVKEVYKFKVEAIPTSHIEKQPRLECAELQTTWLITGENDLWSGRLHQRKKHEGFMSYHCTQSEQLLQERNANQQFKVNIAALMVLKAGKKYSMEVSLIPYPEPQKPITKKDPLRRFFANLKTVLQAYNVKETLEALRDLKITCPSECADEAEDDEMKERELTIKDESAVESSRDK